MTVGDLIFLVTVFVLFVIVSEAIHYLDRKNLYRYIKSENLKDVDRDNKPVSRAPSGHREALDKWRNGGGNK